MIRPKVQLKGNFHATQKLKEAVKKANGAYVSMGVHADAGKYAALGRVKKDGSRGKPPMSVPDVGRVALWLEYGTEHMPARPFLGPALDENQTLVQKKMALGLVGIAFHEWTVEAGLRVVGMTLLTLVQNKVRSNVGPALSGEWEPPKGYLGYKRRVGQGQRTLIATGLMLRSLAFRLLDKNGNLLAKSDPEGDVVNPSGGNEDFAEARKKAREEAHEVKKAQRAQRRAHAGRDEHGRFLAHPKQAAKGKTGKSHQAANAVRGHHRKK